MTLDNLSRLAERALRAAGEARIAIALLLLAAAANAFASISPALRWVLDSPPYLLLVGAILLSGIAAVAVRTPAAWREWRQPGPLTGRSAETVDARMELPEEPAAGQLERVVGALRGAGYRVAVTDRPRWAAHGTRRGWSRFAALGAHLAVVLIVVGAALGSALASETVFSLLPGDQALLDEPRRGFTSAVRLDRFDAEFGGDGRPLRLDTDVTFLRDGVPTESRVLRVNEPGSFDGYLVHAWTYGPAAGVRVVDLTGRTVHDANVALDDTVDGAPGGFVELSPVGATLGVSVVDPARNLARVTLARGSTTVDSVILAPGEESRLGETTVEITGFTSYVTFMSRSDPGLPIVVTGGALLVGSLAVSYYLPRRRCSVQTDGSALLVQVRGERFDRPDDELRRVVDRVTRAL